MLRVTGDVRDDDEMDRIRKFLFSNVTSVEMPMIVFLGGGAAVGKTKGIRPRLEEWRLIPKNHAVINGDEIMTLMNGWNPADVCSASNLYKRASEIVTFFLEEALNKSYHIVYDGTMSKQDATIQRIQMFYNKTVVRHRRLTRKYNMTMVGASAPSALSVHREVGRASKESRYLGLKDIVGTHTGFSRWFLSYTHYFDRSFLYDTTDAANPSLIFNQTKVLDVEAFEAFISKIGETEDSVLRQLHDSVRHSLKRTCSCYEDGYDVPICGSSGGGGDGGSSSEHRAKVAWRAVAISFMALTGVLFVLMLYAYFAFVRRRRSAEADFYEPIHRPQTISGR